MHPDTNKRYTITGQAGTLRTEQVLLNGVGDPSVGRSAHFKVSEERTGSRLRGRENTERQEPKKKNKPTTKGQDIWVKQKRWGECDK